MLRKNDQLLFGDTLGPSGVYTSPVFSLGGYSAITVVVTAGSAPTGSTPTLAWQMQTSPDGVSWSNVGSSFSLSATLLQASSDYSTTTTQGAIAGPYYRVQATPSAGSVWSNMYADIVAQV